jgi:hypothetical protein
MVRLELDLSSLAKKMVGQVVRHNSELAACVEDEVNRMLKTGALESLVRRETETAVMKAVKDVMQCWDVQMHLQKKLKEEILGTQKA